MKILFLTTPLRYGNSIVEPLGFAYMAAVLKQNDFNDIKIVDASSLQLSETQILKEVIEYQPQIIGITAMSINIAHAFQIATLIKSHNPDIRIVAGGAHASILPDEVIQCKAIDIVVRFEGEYTFTELVKAFATGTKIDRINNIVYNEDGKIVHTPLRDRISDLDSLPFPDRDLLPMHVYKAGSLFPYVNGTKKATIMGGRGCPFDCTFCAAKAYWNGKQCTMRSFDSIINEIKFIIGKWGIRNFQFSDENVTLSKKRIVEFCQRIIDEKLSIAYVISSRVSSITEDVAKLLKKSGCCMVLMGIESGSQKIRDNIKKDITQEEILDAFAVTGKIGLRRGGCFLLGCPGETIETFRETIDLACKIDADEYALNIATPYPGTELYEQCVPDKRKLQWENASSVDPQHPDIPNIFYSCCDLSNEEISMLWKEFRRNVELSIRSWRSFYMIVNRIIHINNPRYFFNSLRAAYNLLFKKSAI